MEDRDELKAIKENPYQVFNQLLRSFTPHFYQAVKRLLIIHEDVDDVLQDAFIKIWNALPNFNGESQLKTWAYRIVVNEALQFLKGKKRKAWLVFGNYDVYLENQICTQMDIDGESIEFLLQQAILKLPEQQRVVFNLRYFNELPHQEIASILAISESTVKAHYHLAKNKINSILTNLN